MCYGILDEIIAGFFCFVGFPPLVLIIAVPKSQWPIYG
ncbi:protein of unknown function [uncultured Woeseiaceae bacterium]|uniref:Uncharacterized protein n=1 Tax=uncultured Woeseiaceae bacterium TaxID=1983305 RepID=A0A7D9H6C0_9GAMM|nr:protein of unknown function [uncultured Woeseiaceae bacterium]